MTWTDETREAAFALRATGLSAREVAEALLKRFGIDVSKNSVNGMFNRRGVKAHAQGTRGAINLAKPAYQDPKWKYPATETSLTLTDLTSSQCRWPVATAPGEMQLFCAAPAVPGTPYCKEHNKSARGTEDKEHGDAAKGS